MFFFFFFRIFFFFFLEIYKFEKSCKGTHFISFVDLRRKLQKKDIELAEKENSLLK